MISFGIGSLVSLLWAGVWGKQFSFFQAQFGLNLHPGHWVLPESPMLPGATNLG